MGRVPATAILAALLALPRVAPADSPRGRGGPIPLWYYDQKTRRCVCCTTRDEAIAGIARKGGCKVRDVDVRTLKKGADSLHLLHCRNRVIILAGRKWACNYLRSHAASVAARD
jgi:hypothetical protein